MDQQLLRLQEEFFQIQETKSNPLSDRTLVELLIKLPTFGLIFYQTTDGNQYLTQEHLDKSIVETVTQAAKITISQLAQAIGVNYDVVESRLNLVTNRNNITRIDDKLMSAGYLDSLIQILKQKLESKGRMNIQEIALDFELPLVYARKLVTERIGEIGAEMYNDQLITPEYTQLKKARLAGCLNGIVRPVQLSQLCKTYDLQERNTPETVQTLIEERRLNGRLQHGYYIPHQFQTNQKAIIENMILNSNYVEYSNLNKNFFITKPKEWLKTNFGAKLILLEEVAFSVSALEHSKSTIQNLLKNDGFVELSKVFPSAFNEDDIQRLITEHLELQDIVLRNGYCFDPEWLDKCASQFREKILYYIFFKQEEASPVKGKKTNKSKKPKITEDELAEGLVDSGLIQYNAMEDVRQLLLDLLTPKLDELYTKCSAEVAQNKGVISNTLLKYRKGKTIIKNEEKCLKTLNTIQKQCKKANKTWMDPEYGPTEEDKNGAFGIAYFDKVMPKDWPPLDKYEWVKLPIESRTISSDMFLSPIKSKYLAKSKLVDLLELLCEYNCSFPDRKLPWRFLCPEWNEQFEKSGVNIVKLYNQNEARYILTDNQFPTVKDKSEYFCSYSQKSAWVSIVQKSYAKFRYCYKGTLGVGVTQLAQELGYNCTKRSTDIKNTQAKTDLISFLTKQMGSSMVVLATEGETDADVVHKGQATGLKGNNMYLVHDINREGESGDLLVSIKVRNPGEILRNAGVSEYIQKQQSRGFCVISLQEIGELFRYVYSFN